MSVNGYQFRPALPEEAPLAVDLIQRRIDWMDERGMEQWNVEGYLDIFPLSYFQEHAAAGRLYGLWREGEIAAAAVLLEQDRAWTDDAPAFYVHNLATSLCCPGAGKVMIQCFLDLARRREKQYLRLDCLQDNEKLNSYYEHLGFRFVCPMEDGDYRGYCREYSL